MATALRVSVAAGALAIGLASVAVAGSGVRPRVSPHAGDPRATFTVGFTAPQPAGTHGIFERSYLVNALGPQRRGCASASSATVREAKQGQRVRVVLRSARRWCTGTYMGTISYEQGPHCERGHVCPAFVTQLRTIGRFQFRVR